MSSSPAIILHEWGLMHVRAKTKIVSFVGAVAALLLTVALPGSSQASPKQPTAASVSAGGVTAAANIHMSSEFEHINSGGAQWDFWGYMTCNAGQLYRNGAIGQTHIGSYNSISSFQTWNYCQNNHWDWTNGWGNPNANTQSGWWGGYQGNINNMSGMGDRTESIEWR